MLIIMVILLATASAGCINKLTTIDTSLESIETSLNNSLTEREEKTITASNADKPDKYDIKGRCNYVIDGDTLNVEGVGRIRLVGINAPEKGEPGYIEAKNFLESACLGKIVYLDIDDEKNYDRYGRILAVVYVGSTNINEELLQRGYAEIMYK